MRARLLKRKCEEGRVAGGSICARVLPCDCVYLSKDTPLEGLREVATSTAAGAQPSHASCWYP